MRRSPAVPSFDNPTVSVKVTKFYEDLFSLQSLKCFVRQEQFLFITVNADNVCTRCHRDKHVPKLYCGDNNMDPGPVPTELIICS